MANGQEEGRQNFKDFKTWVTTQTDEDFKQIVHRGKLKRADIAKALGISTNPLRQNPDIKKALAKLEQELRDRGVLPPLSQSAKTQSAGPKSYDPSAQQRAVEAKRLSVLEQENIELKARVATLEAKLRRYGELSEVLTEFGVAPDA